MKNNLRMKPLEYAEQSILKDILDGVYLPGSRLPSEREFAERLGVTRPTLREALGRIERDGWITIQHGKSTVVNNYWEDGGLNILSTLTKMGGEMDWKLVDHVLQVRIDIAPSYAYYAVMRNPDPVLGLLTRVNDLDDSSERYAKFDWDLHHELTVLSGNTIYPLILNGFKPLYQRLAIIYFSRKEERDLSAEFYTDLTKATRDHDPDRARMITLAVMKESMRMMKNRREQ